MTDLTTWIDEIPFRDETDPFLQDSFEVESWSDLYAYAIKAGRKDEFLKKMGEYVKASNLIVQKEFDAYISRRSAEMKAEDLDRRIKKGPDISQTPQE
jgi:uncharacterized FlgJ-related protein